MYILVSAPVVSVSALKPDQMPEVRMETEERQNAGYEVYHQKLVWKPFVSNTVHASSCDVTPTCGLCRTINSFCLMAGVFCWGCGVQQRRHYWTYGWRGCHRNGHSHYPGDAEKETVHFYSSRCDRGKKKGWLLRKSEKICVFISMSRLACFLSVADLLSSVLAGGCSSDPRGASSGQDAAERLWEPHLQILRADAELKKRTPTNSHSRVCSSLVPCLQPLRLQSFTVKEGEKVRSNRPNLVLFET